MSLRKKMKFVLLLTSFILLFSCNSDRLKCGDLLERYAERTQQIDFIECSKGDGQTILEARYNVKGKDSKEIEEFLVQKYGIGKLEFTCCGWESSNGKNGHIDNEELKMINPNYVLEVSMSGNAEKENENGAIFIELDRTKIDFIITVKILNI